MEGSEEGTTDSRGVVGFDYIVLRKELGFYWKCSSRFRRRVSEEIGVLRGGFWNGRG